MRMEVRFEGRVQGVGFRATVWGIAQRHEVSGWVRNEADGAVRMEAVGAPEELDRFLGAIRGAMQGNIARDHVQKDEQSRVFRGFEIRR
jgi:acylphosphatase